jgi:hypothetical protein
MSEFSLKTPVNKWTVGILGLTLTSTAPFVEEFFYRTALHQGRFPTNADAIAIPIHAFQTGWLYFLPFELLLLWLALRPYPGQKEFIWWRRDRPIWSGVWSLFFGLLMLENIYFSIKSIFVVQPLDVIQSLAYFYLFGCLRCSVISSNLWGKT